MMKSLTPSYSGFRLDRREAGRQQRYLLSIRISTKFSAETTTNMDRETYIDAKGRQG
jgi:hypothetical protein